MLNHGKECKCLVSDVNVIHCRANYMHSVWWNVITLLPACSCEWVYFWVNVLNSLFLVMMLMWPKLPQACLFLARPGPLRVVRLQRKLTAYRDFHLAFPPSAGAWMGCNSNGCCEDSPVKMNIQRCLFGACSPFPAAFKGSASIQSILIYIIKAHSWFLVFDLT